MAGEWIKMRRDLPSDPAVIRIRRAVGLDVDTVVGKLHRLWSWADVHTADGSADGLDLEWLDETAGAPGFGAAMVAAGWLEVTDAGLRFANFERHNGQPAKVRALAKTRMKRARCAVSATEAQPEKRREEKRRRRHTDFVGSHEPAASGRLAGPEGGVGCGFWLDGGDGSGSPRVVGGFSRRGDRPGARQGHGLAAGEPHQGRQTQLAAVSRGMAAAVPGPGRNAPRARQCRPAGRASPPARHGRTGDE